MKIIYPTDKLLTVFSLLTEKAKPQPAEEADKSLDKFFSERRPATAPPAVGEGQYIQDVLSQGNSW